MVCSFLVGGGGIRSTSGPMYLWQKIYEAYVVTDTLNSYQVYPTTTSKATRNVCYVVCMNLINMCTAQNIQLYDSM